jgi:hypothetical protein
MPARRDTEALGRFRMVGWWFGLWRPIFPRFTTLWIGVLDCPPGRDHLIAHVGSSFATRHELRSAEVPNVMKPRAGHASRLGNRLFALVITHLSAWVAGPRFRVFVWARWRLRRREHERPSREDRGFDRLALLRPGFPLLNRVRDRLQGQTVPQWRSIEIREEIQRPALPQHGTPFVQDRRFSSLLRFASCCAARR